MISVVAYVPVLRLSALGLFCARHNLRRLSPILPFGLGCRSTRPRHSPWHPHCAPGSTHMQTPSTGAALHQCNLYDVSLLVPALAGAPFFLDATPVMESQLRSQGIDGLLGRDVLEKFVLFYNSPMGGFTLAY